jgi:hypothetical protein
VIGVFFGARQWDAKSMSTPTVPTPSAPAFSFLPPLGSKKYYLLLGLVAVFILGPLGGVTAAYMNFSLGFFIGGQVLAGILGSVVTLGYGSEGKHGANYMQTAAASVAGLSGMGVLIQAMVWMGLPQPPAAKPKPKKSPPRSREKTSSLKLRSTLAAAARVRLKMVSKVVSTFAKPLPKPATSP